MDKRLPMSGCVAMTISLAVAIWKSAIIEASFEVT